jgi:DUF1680 family protein
LKNAILRRYLIAFGITGKGERCGSGYEGASQVMHVFKNKHKAVSFTDTTIEDLFWSARLNANREKTLLHIYETFVREGRFDIYKTRPAASCKPGYKYYWESEVAKWIEGASYVLAAGYDARLDSILDEVIGMVTSVQQPDGYLNAFFTVIKPGDRWKNLFIYHELYNAGALIEAAVAHYGATGKTSLLDPVCRYVDHIDSVFGREPGKKCGYPGHPGIELALVRLLRLTGKKKYLALALYFVDERGRQPNYFSLEDECDGSDKNWVRSLVRYYRWTNRCVYEYNQSHMPVYEQKDAVGHAVRAMYLYSGIADLAYELDNEALISVCRDLWKSVCTKKMYITGGVGSEYLTEGFGPDYYLPDGDAYCETCSAIGLVFWNYRMLLCECDSRYSDVIETALYNVIAAGVSIDGTKFFYRNVLASSGEHVRSSSFECSCCPPNILRLFASLGQYIYSICEDEIAVHLYIQGTAKFSIGKENIKLKQITDYPWDGKVALFFKADKPCKFKLKLRVPGWCRRAEFFVNGEPVPEGDNTVPYRSFTDKGYKVIEREWRCGDRVDINFFMPIEKVYAHSRITSGTGRIALQKGPVVYCVEQVDNQVDFHRISIRSDSKPESNFVKDMLGGIHVIHAEGELIIDGQWGEKLYSPLLPDKIPYKITAVPYCVWANRMNGWMTVWVRYV